MKSFSEPEVHTAVPRSVWAGLVVLLVLSLGLAPLVEVHPHFEIEALPAFSAWFAALSCLGLLALAKVLALFLTRPDSYYGDDHA
jgi:hypothetical protein